MARLRKNLFGNGYLTAGTLVGQVCLVPLYLHNWGAEIYGEWLVLFTIPAFFVVTDAGLANTVGNAVSLSLEQGRPAEAEAQLNAAWKYQALLWAMLFGVLCTVLFVFQMHRWLGVETLPVGVFRATIVLHSLGSFVWLQAGILSAIYRGARCYHLYLTWRAHASVVEALLIVGVLLVGGGFIAVAGTTLSLRIVTTAVLFVRARTVLPTLRPAFFSGRWADLVPMLPSGLSFLSFPVANALINQGTVLAVSHLSGAPAVVLLSVCRQLARLFVRVTDILLGALHPEMTIALAGEDRPRVRELQTLAVMVPVLAALPFLVGVAVLGPGVTEFWTRKSLGVTSWLTLACGVEAIAFACMNLFSLVPWAVSRVHGLSALYAGLNLAGLGLGIKLSYRFGVVGFPVAFAMGNVLYCAIGIRLGASIAGFRVGDVLSLRHAWFLVQQRIICYRRRRLALSACGRAEVGKAG